ncbi:extracellular solute-binding protein [Flexivirga meconopsidis]|uniref:extracellular solute-binding protein n=1 Tax=Flexivirga meconopsidis TaxID=2977121 RepID=UPI0022409AAC|nr:extracellular solute-binding protein [Flexivirga meconopsidis]
MTKRTRRLALSVSGTLALALTAAGCGTINGTAVLSPRTEVGKGEGKVVVLTWPGYVEDGTDDPSVNWVTPFEQQTGCQVEYKNYGTSDEALNLMRSGGYDVVAASGDLTTRLWLGKQVQPLNTDLLTSWPKIFPFLKNTEWTTFDGKPYGIAQGWGANLLTYNTNVVKPAPTSWDSVFGEASKYKGKVTAYDSPIYIADAALYLMKHRPELKIKNPYALDSNQLDAAVKLLSAQKPNLGSYWSDYAAEQQAFTGGDTVLGTAWQLTINAIDKPNIKGIVPREGATAWSDSWMISSYTSRPNCSYKWVDYITSPKVNAESAQYFGESPANADACKYTEKGFCEQYHAADEKYANQLWYWRTPTTECLDGRKGVKCTNYADWTAAWTAMKG